MVMDDARSSRVRAPSSGQRVKLLPPVAERRLSETVLAKARSRGSKSNCALHLDNVAIHAESLVDGAAMAARRP
jgi:hypothetical protein